MPVECYAFFYYGINYYGALTTVHFIKFGLLPHQNTSAYDITSREP